MNKQDLVKIAKETVEILERGGYENKYGYLVTIKNSIEQSVIGTKLYKPENLLKENVPGDVYYGNPPFITITGETTTEAGFRLFDTYNNVAVLNFASAKHPGGGFLWGALAQEECLAYRSGLYSCLLSQPEFYSINKKCGSNLYTDHIIYSPEVTFFRDEDLSLLIEPYFLSVITCPAPNAGEVLSKESSQIKCILERRARDILMVAALNGHRNLVLGAWGCGVFQNNPYDVAMAFKSQLISDWCKGTFDNVVFAIYENNEEKPLMKIFKAVFNV